MTSKLPFSLRALLLPFTIASFLTVLATGTEPSYAPPAISARVSIRYSYGLSKKALAGIGKDRMATTDRYDLPDSKPIVKGEAAEQTIQGTVAIVPLTFYLRLTSTRAGDPGLLELNLLDQKTKKPLPGYPMKITGALAKLKSDDGVEIDLKLTKEESATVISALRDYLGSEAHGSIIADPPFLQIHATPKE